MTVEHHDAHVPPALSKSAANWERMYGQGRWAYLGGLDEAPRFALIAGYVSRLVGSGVLLDAGCGEGHLLAYLDRHRIRYEGFDLSATAVANARAQYPDAEFRAQAIEAFQPPASRAYDVVVFNEVLAHIREPWQQIDSIEQALRRAGCHVESE